LANKRLAANVQQSGFWHLSGKNKGLSKRRARVCAKLELNSLKIEVLKLKIRRKRGKVCEDCYNKVI
jgi:hypothetical protein